MARTLVVGVVFSVGCVVPRPGVEIDERVSTAVHEMGHALLRALIGATVKSVVIYRAFFSSSYGGETCWDFPKLPGVSDDTPITVDDEDIRVISYGCVAGQEAESLWLCSMYGFTMSEARDHTAAGASTDLRNFKTLSRYVDDLTLESARRETDKIILRHWPVIELLSDILSDRYKLSTRVVNKHVTAESDSEVRTVVPKIYVPATAGGK